MNVLTQEEQARLAAVIRPGEQVLWQGKGVAAPLAQRGFWRRLFRRTSVPVASAVYAITARRVLALSPQGQVQEWFLMLGMIQRVDEQPDGSGNIVFDYEERQGVKVPRGIIGVEQVSHVRNILADAIDAAYNASPWSV